MKESEAMHGKEDANTLVKEAIDRATDMCSDNGPLMTQLCRISAEVDKAKKKAKAKRSDEYDAERKQRRPEKDKRRIHVIPTTSLSRKELSPTQVRGAPTATSKANGDMDKRGHVGTSRGPLRFHVACRSCKRPQQQRGIFLASL